ncbi:hypothetical protein HJC23_009916 [Cyclotella cryptica]|uniref:Sulfotransferase n=1 Tax=Cyclotella cryptica TaxID=29204 RepID=A0ABD3P2K6_9STRA|eukprot:CCRYP_018301-RA/>CCRYP_018301-RA protein AED:0.06 eAED:0.06 QI:124/0.66/0.5/1/1/1/4/172/482
MEGEQIMKATTKKSGIGRRRGASQRKSLQTSLLVSVVAFCVTCFVILGVYLSFMSRSRQVQLQVTSKMYEDAPFIDSTRNFLKKRHEHDIEKEIQVDPDETWGPILRAEVHLFDLALGRFGPSSTRPGGYDGVKAKFCKLKWDLHKNDPPKYPMFRFLVSASGCNDRQKVISVDMASLMEKVREYDEIMQQKEESGHVDDIDGYVHVMPPSAFVFHESRVGSTLVANSLAAMDPEANRVFSESTPINMALSVCEGMGADCDLETNANLFRDVVYLMGRTNSIKEKHLFFKVSSAGTKRMKIMREALPSTPWIFVFRNPVQTMMSHLDPAKIGPDTRNILAVCTKAKRSPPDDLIKLVADTGRDIRDISDIEFCAAHLASLCESALKELRKTTTGKAVEYDGLVDKLISDIIPNHFGIEMTSDARQRILDVSKTYSKNKGPRKSEWEEDSEKKEDRATKEIKDASELFMTESYTELQKFTKNN